MMHTASRARPSFYRIAAAPLSRNAHTDRRAEPRLAIVLAAFLSIGASSPAWTQSIADLEAAVAAATTTREPPQGSLVDPEEDRNPAAPLTALQTLVADIEALGPGPFGNGQLPPGSRTHVEAAARFLRNAQEAYGGAEPHIDRVFAGIGAAVGELAQVRLPQGLPFQANLAALSKRLADTARTIAMRVTTLAVEAGARAGVLAQAQLARGDAFVALGSFGPAVGAYADAFTAASGGIVLDLDLLEANIRGALDGETVGYAYMIARDGVLHATSDGVGGLARRSVDPPETPQSSAKEMYIASISKTISATALLKALHDTGIPVDESVGAYLPADWDQGTDFELVTFRHLLTHTSGLDPADITEGGTAPQTDASLQAIVAAGSDDSQRGTHNYRNANFSLMRVLIPRVAYGALVDQLAATWGLDVVHAGLYEYYVSQHVLAPAGVAQTQCQPTESASTRTLLYPFPPDDVHGLDAGDWSLSCGATGWFLSARDLGAFMAHLRFANSILAPATRTLMDQDFLGWLDPVAYANWVQGTWGTYRAHAGDFDNMTGCIMNFPSAANAAFPGVKVQVAVLINSTGGTLGQNLPILTPRRVCTVMKVAYDEAWVAQ
jgi:CubicO group peptidase (beta-lactamase class C family)